MIGTRILTRNSAIGTVLNTIGSNSPVFYSSKQFAFNDNCCWRQSAIDAIYIQFVVWWGGADIRPSSIDVRFSSSYFPLFAGKNARATRMLRFNLAGRKAIEYRE